MNTIINKINGIIENRFISNAEIIAKRLYPRPYFLEEENGGDDEPILFI
ncbi:hypothetical protein [Wenyingzhuangia sp. 2_MG-2023]|nr:hypothetical protein [Wenyingzhuangia sp. 2_MG-2023]MDO6736649.1 hypothetical protein [Wenyingzhuangia sp. 2_MG-2023]MDO6801056.1 hypothetical protein [Wenyingzhuangia sp. 1_MG-2023]